jgi:hypothetical protein
MNSTITAIPTTYCTTPGFMADLAANAFIPHI